MLQGSLNQLQRETAVFIYLLVKALQDAVLSLTTYQANGN